jgi:flagellar hook-associated protein 1 FlgK
MPSINGILSIGRNALSVQQLAINVTGNNIANANTEGYTRQRVTIRASQPLAYPPPGPPGMIGSGVTASEIQRLNDRYLTEQIVAAQHDLGSWEARQAVLEQTETVFNESSGFGLGAAMDDFWNAWQDLANNPAGHTERQVLLAKSELLANTFNGAAEQLDRLQRDTDAMLSGGVAEVNRIADQITDLNDKIEMIERTGQNANDYRDNRERLLKELAGLVDFSAAEGPGGVVTVTLGDGHLLVGQPPFGRLTTVTNAGGLQDVVWDSAPGVPINGSLTGGKLGGLLDARDTLLPAFRSGLDDLAAGIIAEVNGLHAAGVGLLDAVARDFFSGTGAADMAVLPAIAADVSHIAAAPAGGLVPGDNRNAIAIAALQSALTMAGGTATFGDTYQALVSRVGFQVQEARDYTGHQRQLLHYLDNYRESISGVSIDEEMVNLVKFQHAYDAAAKLITTVDEMLATLIEMV